MSGSNRRRVGAVAAGSAALALMLAFVPSPEPARAGGPINVTTQADSLALDGACSLREAIRAANLDEPVDACRAGTGVDTIRLPAGAYTLAIAGVDEDDGLQGDLDIAADLTIRGAGIGQTIVDAAGLDRVFDVFSPAHVRMTDLTIMGGALEDDSLVRQDGAGISNGGSLNLADATVQGNTTLGRGGGIYSTGPLVMTDSLVTGNGSRDGSGGIESSGDTRLDRVEISGNGSSSLAARPGRGDPGDAGGLDVSGYLLLSRSVVSGNRGGGEWAAGGVAMGRGVVIESTIRENSTSSCGPGGIAMVGATLQSSTVSGNAGGYCAEAGGVIAFDSTIVNSTISGNIAGDYGVTASAGGMLASGTTIIGSTIAANLNLADPAWASGGAAGIMAEADAPTTLFATIVAGNLGPNGATPDCVGALTSGGHNLVGDATGCTFAATVSDLVGTDALLGPLADNGGPTETHSLLPGSPAIDAFECAHGDPGPCLAVDQRGVRRPQDGDGDHRKVSDIGSVEVRRSP